MSPADLDRIERELAIALPSEYREVMAAFPVRSCAGNSDRDLWDDADELIRWNRSLREGENGVPPWPQRMFSLGSAGASSSYAIDVEADRAPVWWLDRWRFDAKGSGVVSPAFAAWAKEYFQDLRADCDVDSE